MQNLPRQTHIPHELHLYAMRHSDWCVVCERPEAVVERCRQLVAMTGDDAIRRSAVAATAFVFQNGRQSPAERLSEAMARLVAGEEADDWLQASLDQRPPLASATGLKMRDKDA